MTESRNIILLQGRKYDEGPNENPSVIRMNEHVVLPDIQRAAYSVPLISPTSLLGRSTAEEVHNMNHGAASTNARASRYFLYPIQTTFLQVSVRQLLYLSKAATKERP